MVGISPVFYRIFVTMALVDALVTSTYPVEKTTVFRYVPPVPDPQNYAAEGMRPLENRRIVFQCLEAFKSIVIVSLPHPCDSEGSHISSFNRTIESFCVVDVGFDTRVVSTSFLVKDFSNGAGAKT